MMLDAEKNMTKTQLTTHCDSVVSIDMSRIKTMSKQISVRHSQHGADSMVV